MSSNEKFDKFKQRILNIFQKIDSYFTKNEHHEFCQYFGIAPRYSKDQFYVEGFNDPVNITIYSALEKEKDTIELFRIIEVIFLVEFDDLHIREKFLQDVKVAIDISNIDFTATIVDFNIKIYRKGEEFLDQKLIDKRFTFLNNKSNDHFVKGLDFYKKKEYIQLAESIRRCLEEFLRDKFKNQKGLLANIKNMPQVLNTVEGRGEITSMVIQSLKSLDNYFNDNSKHNDGIIFQSDAEYLIYISGVIMNYIEGKMKSQNLKNTVPPRKISSVRWPGN